MEVIRKFINTDSLMSIMALPETFRNRTLEIIVLPTEEETPAPKKTDIPDLVQSLLGAIPYTDMTLAELREERLKKEECYGKSTPSKQQ